MRHAQSGLTLIEMLVVLTILAMAASLAPTVMAGLEGSRLRAASDQLIALLRTTREDAVRTGRATAFVIDPGTRRYALRDGGPARPLPAAIGAVAIEPAALRQPDGLLRILFRPDGSATAARLTIRGGANRIAIVVDWLTGAVRRDG